MSLFNIAKQFKGGAAAQATAAQQVRKLYRSREAAKAAMIEPMAKAYGDKLNYTSKGVARWAKHGGGKNALSRLLALAFKPRGSSKRSKRNKVSRVELLIKQISKLTVAQRRRVLAACK
jgi:hypothetical protein